MKAFCKTITLAVTALLLLLGIVGPANAAGNCSPYAGLASLNEFFKDRSNQANDPDDFVEIKILDASINFGIFSQWTIQICENDAPGNNNDTDGCSGVISLSSFTDTTPSWLALKDGSIGRYINLKSGFDAILLDANDDVIDYLIVDGHTQQQVAGCPGSALPYDTNAGSPGASDKFIFRSPDGTGDWDKESSGSDPGTEDETNDDDPTIPELTFTQPTITQGTTVATVTLTLAFAASDIISIDFNTFDGTLVAGTDYTTLVTTVAFAIGQTSIDVDIPVSATSNLGQFNFFVAVNTSTAGIASISSHVGQVTVIGAALDHFNINVGAGSANTCNPFSFSVIAEDSSNNPVTGYIGTVSITTSTGNGNFSPIVTTNSLVPNPDDDDDGSAAYTFDLLDSGMITLALANEHAETLTITINDAAATVSSTSSNIIYRDNAFTIIDTDALVAGDDIAVAGRNHAYQIQMIRKDPVTGCGVASGYDGNKPLKMWRSKNAIDPSNSAPLLQGNPLPPVEPAAANGNITFINGVADVFLSTSDIGKYTIDLADISNTFADITIQGASLEQTVRPFGLSVTSIETGIGPTPNPGGSLPTDDIFTSAGSDFSATVAAVLWDGGDDTDNDGVLDTGFYLDNAQTPSYAWDTLLNVVAITPVTGMTGILNNSTVFEAEFIGGTFTMTDLQYSEVGSFTLRASANNFLNTAGANIIGDDIIVGRFTPATLTLTLVSNGEFVDTNLLGALPYTYVGQGFSYATAMEPSFRVTARNVAGDITENYTGAWARVTAASVNLPLPPAQEVTQLGSDAATLMTLSYTQASVFNLNDTGVGSIDFEFPADDTFSYTKDSNSEVAPFAPDINLTVTNVTDLDGITTAGGLILNPDGSNTEIRFGRLRMENTFGSELDNLIMHYHIEYFDKIGAGAGFWTRHDDADSIIALSDIGEVPGTTDAIATAPTTPVLLGKFDITLMAPGAPVTETITIDLNTAPLNQIWLQYDWDGDAFTNFDDNPSALATFGIFEGNPVQIYIQQIYQ